MRVWREDQFFNFIEVGHFFIVSFEGVNTVADANQRQFEFFVAEEREEISGVVVFVPIEGCLNLLYVDYRGFPVAVVDQFTYDLLGGHRLFKFLLCNSVQDELLDFPQTFSHVGVESDNLAFGLLQHCGHSQGLSQPRRASYHHKPATFPGPSLALLHKLTNFLRFPLPIPEDLGRLTPTQHQQSLGLPQLA